MKQGIVILFATMIGFCSTLLYADSHMPPQAAQCVACHMQDGNSTIGMWPKIAGQHPEYLLKQLQDFKKGQEGPRHNAVMLGIVTPLSDDDMLVLTKYYSTQTMSKGSSQADQKTLKQGQEIYLRGNAEKGIAACVACHGPKGVGLAQAGYPKIAGQHVQYTEIQLKAYRSGERSNDANEIMRQLTKKHDRFRN